MTAYSGTSLTINADAIGGNAGASYSSWQITLSIDLTGGTFEATMRLAPHSCPGRVRTPVTLTVTLDTDTTNGVFAIYLSPAQTSALTLGVYGYTVLFSPASSSDKFLVVSGTITVSDE